jgi:hypothetical protein
MDLFIALFGSGIHGRGHGDGVFSFKQIDECLSFDIQYSLFDLPARP